MTKPFENPFEDHADDRPLVDHSATQLEQQLKAFRPRQPQLDWQAIALATSQDLPACEPSVISVRSQPRFTVRQMGLAIVASWLLGAVIGGTCIYSSFPWRTAPVLSTNDTQSHILAADPGQPHAPTSIGSASKDVPSSPQSANSPRSQPIDQASELVILSALERGSMSWQMNEPLSVRSVTSTRSLDGLIASSHRATVKTPAPIASQMASSNSAEATSRKSIDDPSTVKSNRQQMMREYLRN